MPSGFKGALILVAAIVVGMLIYGWVSKKLVTA